MLPFPRKTLVPVTDRAENTESFLKRKVSLSSHFDVSLIHFLINDPFAIYSYVYIVISLDVVIISNPPLLILRSVESSPLRVPAWPFSLASASSGDADGSLRIGFWTRPSFLVPADGAHSVQCSP